MPGFSLAVRVFTMTALIWIIGICAALPKFGGFASEFIAAAQDTTKENNLDSIFGVPDLPDVPAPNPDQTDVLSESDTISPMVSITGEFRQETAYRVGSPRQFSKLKNTLNIKTSGSIAKNLSFVLGARVSYDPIFDFTENYNDRVADDQSVRKDLRDAYVDFGFGNFDFRLGNQQIVWGQAVGLFFADIVNPLDLREFILPDLEQIRIPVPAANMEYYHDNLYFQMIFIPFPEFNEFGEPGSEFDFSQQVFSQNADIVFNDPKKPANSLDNSEVGFRTSIFTHGWNLSAFYLYDLYNFPVNYRTLVLNPPGALRPATFTYAPEYERIHRFGTTFSKNIGDAILKGEFLYSSKLFFPSGNTQDIDGIENSGTFDWLVGVDYTFFGKLDTNFQLFQNIILDHSSWMTQDQFRTSFSIWLNTGFFDNKIEPELFLAFRLDETDVMFRPKITYNHSGKLQFSLGADIFDGDADGAFGMFDETDRIYIESVYTF